MSKDFAIRQAQPQDIPQLAQIWLQMMTSHERRDARFALAGDGLERWRVLAADMIADSAGFLMAAHEHGSDSLVGFCLGWVARNAPIYRQDEIGFISEIAVDESFRRCGVAKALVQSAQQWFRQRNLEEFQLSAAVWNEPADGFWRAVGAEPLMTRYRVPL